MRPLRPRRPSRDQACRGPWHRRARSALHRSLRLRLMVVFVLLALALTVTFMGGVQKALSGDWHNAAYTLLADYVDRLAQEVGSPPSVARAQALTDRLPITIRIDGPDVHWASSPAQPAWQHAAEGWQNLLTRTTADGHRLEFGLKTLDWGRRPRAAWLTLGVLLLFTVLAYGYIRRLLRPLDDIRAGAQRFGAGVFDQPIPVRHAHHPDELGQLAATVNTMGSDIHHMLEAKRALLLAMSHELRSPLTRARLNTELLPEAAADAGPRQALLRDLGEMGRIITDLLESERLASPHAALQREPVDLAALAHEVAAELSARHAGASAVPIHADRTLGVQQLDRARMRLLLRNLLDNSLRHGGAAAQPPALQLQADATHITIRMRDHGPGVPPEHLAQLSQAFYRPDSARQRSTGGVGLGLYLCRLVAQAHGGQLTLRNAAPGLEVLVTLPRHDASGAAAHAQ